MFQNPDNIHALAGVVSLATRSASYVEGGNDQIFSNFLQQSGAKLFLNTTVKEISPRASESRAWTVTSDSGVLHYKAVIIAAPFHTSSITVPDTISTIVPEHPYVRLHVTLITSHSQYPNASYFSLPEGTQLPRLLLTTYEGARNGGKEPEFISIGYQGQVKEGEWAFKIFSQEKLNDEWLQNVFGTVGWVHRKEVQMLFLFYRIFFLTGKN